MFIERSVTQGHSGGVQCAAKVVVGQLKSVAPYEYLLFCGPKLPKNIRAVRFTSFAYNGDNETRWS